MIYRVLFYCLAANQTTILSGDKYCCLPCLRRRGPKTDSVRVKFRRSLFVRVDSGHEITECDCVLLCPHGAAHAQVTSNRFCTAIRSSRCATAAPAAWFPSSRSEPPSQCRSSWFRRHSATFHRPSKGCGAASRGRLQQWMLQTRSDLV